MRHEITMQVAIEMTKRFRENQPAGMPRCETFERPVIDRLLSTPGCTRLRIYYGMKNNDKEVHAILVAVDANDRDMLPSMIEGRMDDEEQGLIVEDSFRCPPDCPPDSPLNPKKL